MHFATVYPLSLYDVNFYLKLYRSCSCPT